MRFSAFKSHIWGLYEYIIETFFSELEGGVGGIPEKLQILRGGGVLIFQV
jgi:hypothetical protein